MVEFAEMAAYTDCPVLLHGETGSGKTHLANLIHNLSRRAAGPLMRINCAAIPEPLFEGEMFGHVRGAFTDAREERVGVIEAADRGTLFLDELGDMPLLLQPKLLAVLEDGQVRRLGSTRSISVSVRLIAASNRDLASMVAQKEFRADLYYRCAVLEFSVPPLRERPDDIHAIAESLLTRISPDAHLELSDDAVDLLRSYQWPGNIREMENLLRHAAASVRSGTIRASDLPRKVIAPRLAVGAGTVVGARRYSRPKCSAQEMSLIRQALISEGGNKTRAAERLGMSRTTLWAKLQRYPGFAE